jgi:hypothetical protein
MALALKTSGFPALGKAQRIELLLDGTRRQKLGIKAAVTESKQRGLKQGASGWSGQFGGRTFWRIDDPR